MRPGGDFARPARWLRIDAQREAERRPAPARRRSTGGADQVGHLHLARAQRHAHARRRRRARKVAAERADEQQELAEAPDAVPKRHEQARSYHEVVTQVEPAATRRTGLRAAIVARRAPRRRTPRARARTAASAACRARRATARAAPWRRCADRRARSRAARRGTRRRRPRSPPARSSRSRRPDGRPAATTSAARVEQRAADRARAPARSASRAPPADVRIAPDGAEPGAGRVDEHAIERAARTAAARAAGTCTTWTCARRWRGPCRRSSATRRGRTSHATSDPVSRMSAAIAVVLPPGDAHRSSTRSPGRAPTASGTSCDASSWTTNDPSRGAAKRVARGDDQAVRRVARRLGLDAVGARARARDVLAASRAAVGAQRQRAASSLLNRTQRSAASKPCRSSQRATSQSGCECVMPR